MNRKNLTAAVLAGLAGVAGIAGTAQAVNINPDGTGQVLLYPYYTSNDGNQTLISVVNTTENAKAVKVRFLEGYNSREVLDFNLYLSREDVWVASVINGEDFTGDASLAQSTWLLIPDTSCTVPYLYETKQIELADGSKAGLQEFLSLAYAGAANDGGPGAEDEFPNIPRAAEGHIEMIEMGTLFDDGDYDVETWVTHDQTTGMPADCGKLTDMWTEYRNPNGTINTELSGIWIVEGLDNIGGPDQAQTGTSRNSGGLFGGAAVVNSTNGTMFSYDAKAVQGFDKSSFGLHYQPGDIYPSLSSGDEDTAYVFFGVPQNQAVPVTYDDDLEYTVDAVSAVFMHDFVMNEYVVQEDIFAGTEWVITFPTKNFYADPARMAAEDLEWPTMPEGCVSGTEGCVDYARAPFTELYGATDSDGNRLCEGVALKTWDREELTAGEEPGPGPQPVPPVVSPSPDVDCAELGNCPVGETFFELCNEVNVLRFGDRSVFGTPTIEGDSLLLEVEDEFDAGWGRINFTYNTRTGQMRTDAEGLVGLPVTGFAAYEFENEFVGGADVKAYYGGLFGHKASVRATSPAIWPPRADD